MKKISMYILLMGVLFSCRESEQQGRFTLVGNMANADDQQVYLEQLFFTEKNPEVLDTASMRNGKFDLVGTADEEGMFRLRLEKYPNGFIFINDANRIPFSADLKNVNLDNPVFNSPANRTLKNFIIDLDRRRKEIESATKNAANQLPGDSTLIANTPSAKDLNEAFNQYLIKFVDTVSSPVVAMFALGYSGNMEVDLIGKSIAALGSRFPKHKGVAQLTAQFNKYLASSKENKEQPVKNERPGIGSMAPDFMMNDTDGNSFSLSQLKGKYVLVDFWASWCGPCRGENPNVVAAYQTFKNKNFTILGVSLDEEKDAWIKAIQKDQLTWMHVSDLKGWQSAAVGLYGFNGIPYNVLLDPTGKIIATELRGGDLHTALEKLLK